MLLIIFGAGASHDHDEYAINNSRYPRLPLTNEIISDKFPYAQQAKTKWPGAVPLLNRLSAIHKIQKQVFNLEEALYQELRRNKESVKGQLLTFQYYIHDIIKYSETEIRRKNQGNTNYTALLDKLQQKEVDQKMGIALVTFNYDTLLDTACNQLYPSWSFNQFDDYTEGNSTVRLYKPHGSLSWKRIYSLRHSPHKLNLIKILLAPDKFIEQEVSEQVCKYNFEHESPETFRNYITEPIIALPYKEKTDFVFPKKHRESLSSDIQKITHILCIGWKGEEKHFHKEFLSKIPENQLKIMIVNKGGEEIKKNLTETFDDRIANIQTFNEGFSSFLRYEDLMNDFLK